MAVQTRMAQSSGLTEMLSHLKDLAQIINDPAKIEKAHEIARQQNTLTDEEQKKVDEARASVIHHQELHAALTKGHEKLKIEKNDHISNVTLFQEKYDSMMAEIAAKEEIINNRNAVLVANEKTLAEDIKQLEIERVALEKQEQINQKNLMDAQKRLTVWEAELMEEKARISARAKDLNEKSEVLKTMFGQ